MGVVQRDRGGRHDRVLAIALIWLAGALAPAAAQGASPLTWSAPALMAHQKPFATGVQLPAMSCPTTTLCVAGTNRGGIVSTTNPTGPSSAWTPANVDGSTPIPGMSCPSTTLCVGVDEIGNILTSTNPTGGAGAWTAIAPDGNATGFYDVDCQSTTFCVAVGADATGGRIFTSTNPTGGAGAWTAFSVEPGQALLGVSCPSTSLCVLGGTNGRFVTSTDPTSPTATWTTTAQTTGLHIWDVDCPTATLCVALDRGPASGTFVTSIRSSTNPTGNAAAWPETLGQQGDRAMEDVACPSTSLCVVAGHQASVFGAHVWTSPTPGTGSWTEETIGQDAMASVSCPTSPSLLCVGGGGYAGIRTATDPTGNQFAWTRSWAVDGDNAFSRVACPAPALCVAVDTAGNVAATTDPAASAPWPTTLVFGTPDAPADGFNDITCPSPSLCVAAMRSGRIATSTNPVGGSGAWTDASIGGAMEMRGISCAGGLCVAVDGAGQVFSSTDPTGGDPAWSSGVTIASTGLTAISCASASLCVAIDDGGHLHVSTNPAGLESAWSDVALDGGYVLRDVACPATTLCVVIDAGAGVTTSVNPTGGATAWTRVVASDFAVRDVTCPSVLLCVAVGYAGTIASVDPAAGGGAWFTQAPATGLLGVACSGISFCVTTDERGRSLFGGVTRSTVTIAKAGSGSGTVAANGAGIDCGATCSGQVPAGAKVELTAAPAADSVFAGWSGGGCSGTGACTVTADAATTVTATFDLEPAPAATPTATPSSTPAATATPTPGPARPATPPPPAFGAAGVITGLPSTKACVSRRSFTIRIRKRRGREYTSVLVKLNGKRVGAVRRGVKVYAPIVLRGLPKGRFTVKITVITTLGEIITGTRKYRTCARKRSGSGRTPL